MYIYIYIYLNQSSYVCIIYIYTHVGMYIHPIGGAEGYRRPGAARAAATGGPTTHEQLKTELNKHKR